MIAAPGPPRNFALVPLGVWRAVWPANRLLKKEDGPPTNEDARG
jgi:hypothetical protein